VYVRESMHIGRKYAAYIQTYIQTDIHTYRHTCIQT